MANLSLTQAALLLAVATFGVYIVHADVSHLAGQQQQQQPVTEVCLGCICEAISGCNQTLNCAGDVCGLFRITWAYWADAGKPTVGGESIDSQTAYGNCANQPVCAARTVQGYMARFGQDCNGDGVINCLDHAAIHIHGGYGCRNALPPKYGYKFNECIQNVAGLH